jgi:hypothetical protein
MTRRPTAVYEGFRSPAVDRRVTVDGVELSPLPSQSVRNHSPDGFNWGYGGSGPAQLALALLLDATGSAEVAERWYQWFKWAVVARWGQSWQISAGEVRDWVERARQDDEAESAAPVAPELGGEGGVE